MLTGIDVLSTGLLGTLRRRMRSNRVGLLTHAAAVDRRGRPTLDVLDELGASLSLVLTPEHGYAGVAQAEEAVLDGNDAKTAVGIEVPVVSLYGTNKESLTPSPDLLSTIDLLVIDLVDVGARYYTYMWTALVAARAAAAEKVHVVVLDRPNPISGDPSTIEGAYQTEAFRSLVGWEITPIRHALTLGEMVAYFMSRDGLPLGPEGALTVVGAQGWERYRTACAWGRPFLPPSPNMPTLDTALVYPGACLLEGTNLSEGRGTTLPFQCVGAPFLDGEKLAKALNQHGLPGALVRRTAFRPTFGKHVGMICHGVMIHPVEPALFRPVATYAALIALAQRQAPDQFQFLDRIYEFESERLAFDLLAGSPRMRELMLEGASVEDVIASVAPADPSWSEEVVATAEARTQTAGEVR